MTDADIVDAISEAIKSSRTELGQNCRSPKEMSALLLARFAALDPKSKQREGC